MKVVKKIILIALALIALLIIFVISDTLIYKNITYPKWIQEYMKNKYSENLNIIVKDTYFADIGYCAVASTDTNIDLDFRVFAKYTDTYLERILEYDAEMEIEALFYGSKCTASMFSPQSIQSPYPELYDLYKQLQRPPGWNDVPQYVRLSELFITIDEESLLSSPDEIIQKLNLCKFTSHKVDISINNKTYTFNYNENTCRYIME